MWCFLRKEHEHAGNYQCGIVKGVEVSRDLKIRSVIVEYTKHNDCIKRESRRAVREIVVVHPVDELGIIREIGEIATLVDIREICEIATLVDIQLKVSTDMST